MAYAKGLGIGTVRAWGAGSEYVTTVGKALIKLGGAIATNDPGLTKIGIELPKQKNVTNKNEKFFGIIIPTRQLGNVAATETVELRFESEGRNFKTVRIECRKGMSAATVNSLIRNKLDAAKLVVRHVRYDSMIVNNVIDALAIDYLKDGDVITRVTLRYNNIIPVELAAGEFPSFGAASYGERANICLRDKVSPKLFHDIMGDVKIGKSIFARIENILKPSLSLLVLYFGKNSNNHQLLGNWVLGDMTLLPPFLFPMTRNAAGRALLPLPIPNNPLFVGLQFFTQGAVSDGLKLCLTNAQQFKIGP